MKKKMKTVTIVALFATALFVACKKEFSKPSTSAKPATNGAPLMRETFDYSIHEHQWNETSAPILNNSTINDIISSNIVSAALTTEDLHINTPGYFSTLTDASDNNLVYSIELTHPDTTVSSAGLIIYPVDPAHKIYLVYITETLKSGNTSRALIRSVTSTAPYINLDPQATDPLAAVGTSWAERRAKFKGCMIAAWNDLTSDLVHAVGCNSVFMNVCLAACVATCAHHLAGDVATGPCGAVTTPEEILACLCDLKLTVCQPTDAITTTNGYHFPTY